MKLPKGAGSVYNRAVFTTTGRQTSLHETPASFRRSGGSGAARSPKALDREVMNHSACGRETIGGLASRGDCRDVTSPEPKPAMVRKSH